MTKKDLRKEFEKEMLILQNRTLNIKINFLLDWYKAIITIRHFTQGGKNEALYGNLNYVKWLENKIIGGN